MNTEAQSVRIFIAYAHEDAASRERLRIHLNVLQRHGMCHIFWDGLIKPGERWDDRLKAELHQADIFLLLVSEHFLDSDYVHEVELPKALELRNQGQAEVLPVILRHCPWKYTKLADFQCILYEGRPIEDSNGFAHVADLVAETALQLNAKRAAEIQAASDAVAREKTEKEAVEQAKRAAKIAEAETRRLARDKSVKEQTAREQQIREQADHDFWEFAEEANTEPSYKKYLQKYPDGLHAASAKKKIAAYEQAREDALAAEKEAARKKREQEAAEKKKREQAQRDADRSLQDDKKNDDKKNDPFADLMISIKGDTFDMGDTFGDGGGSEKPVHRVTVKDFHLCKYPVTQAQWKAIMGKNPSNFKGDDNLPVEQVSWDDAQAFIKKLNEMPPPGGGQKPYRLPTEAEWEFAAREGGKKVRFGNGKDIADPKEINFDGSKDYKKPYSVVGEDRKKTTPVTTFAPNALGLYQMSGNVWEWCQDLWHENYKGAPDDGSAWEKGGDSSHRVVRGGSWDNNPDDCRAACRDRYDTVSRFITIGFRLAR